MSAKHDTLQMASSPMLRKFGVDASPALPSSEDNLLISQILSANVMANNALPLSLALDCRCPLGVNDTLGHTPVTRGEKTGLVLLRRAIKPVDFLLFWTDAASAFEESSPKAGTPMECSRCGCMVQPEPTTFGTSFVLVQTALQLCGSNIIDH
jgi:hypothetical protein